MMCVAWFDCEMATLRVEGPPASLELFDWLLKSRKLPSQPQTLKTINISIREDRSEISPLKKSVAELALESGQKLKVVEQEDAVFAAYHDNGASVAFLRSGDAIVYGVGSRNAENPEIAELILMALDHAITAMGQSFVHAACLEVPDGSSAMLLHAASGTGKTTTSMALIKEGYRIISDDAAVLKHQKETDQVMAWGVPRAPKVHVNTIRELPFLAEYSDARNSDKAGEQFLDRNALIDAQFFKDSKALPVSAVVSLSRDTTRPASIVKVSAFDAVNDLLEDNLSAVNGRLIPNHEDRLTAYANLARHCSCYRVNINATPTLTANMIASLIAQDN